MREHFRLKEAGALTEAEYEAAKRRILATHGPLDLRRQIEEGDQPREIVRSGSPQAGAEERKPATGRVTVAHLHFGVTSNGTTVDPAPMPCHPTPGEPATLRPFDLRLPGANPFDDRGGGKLPRGHRFRRGKRYHPGPMSPGEMQAVNLALARISTVGLLLTLTSGVLTGASAAKPPEDGIYLPAAATQSETDEYTRYELLAPDSGKFRITYEVTATTAGARTFYNPIRKGSAASDEAVLDAMTGKPLHFEVVSGADARKDPLMPDADLDTDYIKVTLARPVPTNGQGRLIILKTYEDRKSYYVDGKTIVFDRPLGIRRNKVVLPAGYEVVGLTVPSQIITEADGRIGISFVNGTEGEAPLVLRAAKGARTGAAAAPKAATQAAQLGIAVRRRDRGGSPRRARASGSRHRLLPAAARVARVPALPRLHRVAPGHQRLRQRRPQGQHGQPSVGEHSRYRRAAGGEGDERRRDGRARRSMPANPSIPTRASS